MVVLTGSYKLLELAILETPEDPLIDLEATLLTGVPELLLMTRLIAWDKFSNWAGEQIRVSIAIAVRFSLLSRVFTFCSSEQYSFNFKHSSFI